MDHVNEQLLWLALGTSYMIYQHCKNKIGNLLLVFIELFAVTHADKEHIELVALPERL